MNIEEEIETWESWGPEEEDIDEGPDSILQSFEQDNEDLIQELRTKYGFVRFIRLEEDDTNQIFGIRIPSRESLIQFTNQVSNGNRMLGMEALVRASVVYPNQVELKRVVTANYGIVLPLGGECSRVAGTTWQVQYLEKEELEEESSNNQVIAELLKKNSTVKFFRLDLDETKQLFGSIVPIRAEINRFAKATQGDDGRDRLPAMENLIISSLVYPDLEVVRKFLRERPGVAFPIGNALNERAGTTWQVRRKN